MANWMMQGIATPDEVSGALSGMAAKVDAQNVGDPLCRTMAGREDDSLGFQAARALVFEGTAQPSGYTGPLLHCFYTEAGARGGFETAYAKVGEWKWLAETCRPLSDESVTGAASDERLGRGAGAG